MIAHERRQFAVGQGCFHAGLVGDAAVVGSGGFNAPGIRYVYDCGAMAKYKAAREAEIGRYLLDSDRRTIDFLFLSHLHEDHVSGVEQLCALADGADVDTVVLPLLNAVDRLICFARAVAENPDYDDTFHAALTADPVSALARFNPRRIIFVRRGEGPTSGPREGVMPETPDGGPRDDGHRIESRGGCKWRFIGPGRAERVAENVQSTSPGWGGLAEEVYEIDDTCAIQISTGTDASAWILAPYVDVGVTQARAAFLHAAANAYGMVTAAEFEAMAADPGWLLILVTQYKAELAAAYEAVANLNVTSLCLFSGPYQPPGAASWSADLGALFWREFHVDRIGWFGTGDADLQKPARLAAFLAHFAGYLTAARTLLLPHHGSERNFDPGLLAGLNPELTIAAADTYGKWRHPGSRVVQAVCARGKPLWVVTSSRCSAVRERALMGAATDDVSSMLI